MHHTLTSIDHPLSALLHNTLTPDNDSREIPVRPVVLQLWQVLTDVNCGGEDVVETTDVIVRPSQYPRKRRDSLFPESSISLVFDGKTGGGH